MKVPKLQIFTIAAFMVTTIMALLASTVTARHYYTQLIAPRSYQYNRPYSYYDPFDFISEMIRVPINLNSMLQQQQQQQQQHTTTTTMTTPRYVVSESNGIMQLEMEVPGMTIQSLDITLEDDQLLHIKGKRTTTTTSMIGGQQESNHHPQYYESELNMTFRLNENVDPKQLQANLTAGILTIQVPYKEKVIKQIPIVSNGNDHDNVVVPVQEISTTTTNQNHNNNDETTIQEQQQQPLDSDMTTVEVDGITISDNES